MSGNDTCAIAFRMSLEKKMRREGQVPPDARAALATCGCGCCVRAATDRACVGRLASHPCPTSRASAVL
eukprot:100233-Rhodomonas_salina.1